MSPLAPSRAADEKDKARRMDVIANTIVAEAAKVADGPPCIPPPPLRV